MAANSKIEWTDSTWNPIRARNLETGGVGHFCEHASEGCRFCYSERFQPRFKNPVRFARQDRDKVEIYLDEETLLEPLRWRTPRTIFPCSMTDMFAEFVPDEWIDKINAVMALAHWHTFQVLTKRTIRMREYYERSKGSLDRRTAAIGYAQFDVVDKLGKVPAGIAWGPVNHSLPAANVWLGTSVENEATAWRLAPLGATRAAKRFVSYEPALGIVAFAPWLAMTPRSFDWLIAGGESGDNARPSHPDWFRAARDACAAYGVPFFFKQWGEWAAIVDRDHDDPDWRLPYSGELCDSRPDISWLNLKGGSGFHGERFHVMRRVGKKATGRLLDGVLHDAMPATRGQEMALAVLAQEERRLDLD